MLRPSGVSSASEASCAASASSRSVTPGAGRKAARLAVAERDGAGLVEQQHVDVAGRLDRAARGRDHVGLHHAAHAGDADRREQPPMVVGIRHTSSATSTVIVTGVPALAASTL